MNRFKINRSEYANIYFASDFHLNHSYHRDFIHTPRGFNTPQEHDAAILSFFNSLTKDDALFFLGDFCLYSSSSELRTWTGMIPSAVYYISGNHESAWKGVEFPRNFSYLGEKKELTIFDKKKRLVTLCHFPMEEWDHMNRGSYHLHGHCHGGIQTSRHDNFSMRRLDVGVDNALLYNGRVAFSWEDVVDIMSRKLIYERHHNYETV